ncbi:hypothetical protein NDU88_006386 [Pleurodeles waltl]|uniref:Uncharacterized protein n=1 Tax=Pleurodeles waltl TaxID=8319 RepID=A0AAV7LPG6_PLEWA|nr:hypothetical protein NDU88_006386 [Pleurodeles waltl]
MGSLGPGEENAALAEEKEVRTATALEQKEAAAVLATEERKATLDLGALRLDVDRGENRATAVLVTEEKQAAVSIAWRTRLALEEQMGALAHEKSQHQWT